MYLKLEKQRKQNGYQLEDTEDLSEEKKKFLIECEHMHNKALFDAVNESLIQFKPYGKDGEPQPWSNKLRKLQKTPLEKEIDTKKMFEIIKHDVSQGNY